MDRSWQVVFAVGPAACSTVPALTTSGCRCIALPGSDHDEPAVLGEIAGGRAELFIIDHYGRAATFERECRALAQQVVVFDDGTGRDHDCDLLIDAAGDPSCYAPHVPHGARLATGPSFALVRQDFVAHRETSLSRRDGRPVRRILVSFGLADTANATGIALDALASAVGEATIDVVISSRAVHFNDIVRRAGERVRVIVDPVDMPGLMTQADLAVGAAGASAYERAALGLPSIIVATADNQLGVCRLMAEAGAAIYVGNLVPDLANEVVRAVAALVANQDERLKMSQAAARLVDGQGSTRLVVVAAGQIRTEAGERVRLRLAEPQDEHWILRLQQAPETRQFSRNQAIPTADEHNRWMRHILDDQDTTLCVIEVDEAAAGTVRLDRKGDRDGMARYEISIAIDPSLHGRGFGSAALTLVRRMQPNAVLDATVMQDNAASRRLFGAANYSRVGEDLYRSLPTPRQTIAD